MKNRVYVLKRFIQIYMAIALPLSIIGMYFYYQDSKKDEEHLKQLAYSGTALIKELVQDDLKKTVTDLMYISSESELKACLTTKTEDACNNFVNEYINFIIEKRIYDQIRLLDESGAEIVRINYNNGKPYAVPRTELQDKSERYYFQDVWRLEQNQVYISPFDLNIENGNVEIPFKPIIRLGTPFFDAKGRKKGVIILNYIGSGLINIVRKISAQSPHVRGYMLLNRNGYWLIGPHKKDEWTFMFPDKKEHSFAKKYPEAWGKIINQDSGQFNSPLGVTTFDTIYPLSEVPLSVFRQSGMKSDEPNAPDAGKLKDLAYFWKIVKTFPLGATDLAPIDFLQAFLRKYFIFFVLHTFGCLLFAFTDVTRRQAKDEMMRLHHAVEQCPVSIMITDKKGVIQYANPKFSDVSGYANAEILGQTMQILKSGKQSPEFYDNLWENLLAGRDWHGEFQNRKKSGDLFWEQATISPTLDKKGKITNFIAIKEDITEKKVTELELRRLASFPSDNPNIVVETDLNCHITYINPAGIQRFPELKYFKGNLCRHPLFPDIDTIISDFQDGKIETAVHELTIDASVYTRTVKFVPGISTVRIYVHDITGLKMIEHELKDAKIVAELANKQKSLFLANMSHEIRTPLNSVIGFTELLLTDENDVRKRKRLGMISRSGKNLLNIINDILDFSKIEADELEIAPQKFDILAMFELIQEMFEPLAAAKGLGFHLKIADAFPGDVTGDSHRINQILVNLLSNAMKFTHQGSISLICTYKQEWATLKVVDMGIGIAKEKQDIIFSPFRQADDSTSREFGGTGLGLAITKRLITMLGGAITLKSEPEVGSAFTVRLPLPPASEDDASHRQTDKAPAKAKPGTDGEAMVAQWLQPGSEGFDRAEYVRLCLLDLPSKLTHLRDAIMRNQRKDIEFIAHEIKGSVGNLEMTEIYEAALAINDEIIKKDYDINLIKRLFNNLEDILASVPDAYFKDEMGELLNRIGKKSVTSDFKILVAEDNMMNQLLITDLLERINLNVAIAENGREALDMLARDNYDLLLLDIQMPVMDGMETITRIRADENLKNIHVIALTANALKGDAEKFIKAGCDDYLPKPIKFAGLYTKIGSIIADRAQNVKVT